MATPTVGTLVMKGIKTGTVKVLSIYNPSALGVGAYVNVDWNAPASATSPDFFTCPGNGEDFQIMDFLPTAATGQIEFTSDGARTGVILDYSTWAASNPSRPVSSLPRISKGKLYRMLVVVVLAT
jgi:hypothetical protein